VVVCWEGQDELRNKEGGLKRLRDERKRVGQNIVGFKTVVGRPRGHV